MPLPAQNYRLGMAGGRFRPLRFPPSPVQTAPPQQVIPEVSPLPGSRLAPQIATRLTPRVAPPAPATPDPEDRLMQEYLTAVGAAPPVPRREDMPAPSRLQRILGTAATGWAGGMGGPEAAQKTYEGIFERPYQRAMEEYGVEEGQRQQRVAELEPALRLQEQGKTRLAIAEETRQGRLTEAMRRRLQWADEKAGQIRAQEQAAVLARERMAEQASKTIETAEGIFQWNPATQKYDIRVGKGKKDAEKPRPKTVTQYDPATKKTWSITVDMDTGQEISRTETSKAPKEGTVPPAIKKDLATLDATDKLLATIEAKVALNPGWVRGSLTGVGALYGRVQEKRGKLSAEEELFRKEVKGNLVQQIHQLSGAAVSPTEAERLIQALPDFDAMSQPEFVQAVKAARTWIRMKKESLEVQFGLTRQTAVEDLSELSTEELLQRLTQP